MNSEPRQECPHNKCTNNKGDRCILIARLYEECNEVLGKCPECGGPATHPSGLCRDCLQAKLEAEEL